MPFVFHKEFFVTVNSTDWTVEFGLVFILIEENKFDFDGTVDKLMFYVLFF